MAKFINQASIYSIKFLRVIGILEGISYLVLLMIAMPIKYMAGYPDPVKYVGWAHGLLFILYILAAVQATFLRKWPWGKTFYAFVASLIPFGTFVFDKKLKKEQKEMVLQL